MMLAKFEEEMAVFAKSCRRYLSHEMLTSLDAVAEVAKGLWLLLQVALIRFNLDKFW